MGNKSRGYVNVTVMNGGGLSGLVFWLCDSRDRSRAVTEKMQFGPQNGLFHLARLIGLLGGFGIAILTVAAAGGQSLIEDVSLRMMLALVLTLGYYALVMCGFWLFVSRQHKLYMFGLPTEEEEIAADVDLLIMHGGLAQSCDFQRLPVESLFRCLGCDTPRVRELAAGILKELPKPVVEFGLRQYQDYLKSDALTLLLDEQMEPRTAELHDMRVRPWPAEMPALDFSGVPVS